MSGDLDLIVGKVYYTNDAYPWIIRIKYIEPYNRLALFSYIKLPSSTSAPRFSSKACVINYVDTFIEATKEQIQWLETCEKADEFVSKEEVCKQQEFVLPEKWCIFPKEEEFKVVIKWSQEKQPGYYVGKYNWHNKVSFDYNGMYREYEDIQITFEQFKKYVLKEVYTSPINQEDLCVFCGKNIEKTLNPQNPVCEGSYCEEAKALFNDSKEWWEDLKKGDYAVCILEESYSFSKNYIFKLRESTDNRSYNNYAAIRPELDCKGSVTNGYSAKNFRLATPEEIKLYEHAGKPVDVTTYKITVKDMEYVKVKFEKEGANYNNFKGETLPYYFRKLKEPVIKVISTNSDVVYGFIGNEKVCFHKNAVSPSTKEAYEVQFNTIEAISKLDKDGNPMVIGALYTIHAQICYYCGINEYGSDTFEFTNYKAAVDVELPKNWVSKGNNTYWFLDTKEVVKSECIITVIGGGITVLKEEAVIESPDTLKPISILEPTNKINIQINKPSDAIEFSKIKLL